MAWERKSKAEQSEHRQVKSHAEHCEININWSNYKTIKT